MSGSVGIIRNKTNELKEYSNSQIPFALVVDRRWGERLTKSVSLSWSKIPLPLNQLSELPFSTSFADWHSYSNIAGHLMHKVEVTSILSYMSFRTFSNTSLLLQVNRSFNNFVQKYQYNRLLTLRMDTLVSKAANRAVLSLNSTIPSSWLNGRWHIGTNISVDQTFISVENELYKVQNNNYAFFCDIVAKYRNHWYVYWDNSFSTSVNKFPHSLQETTPPTIRTIRSSFKNRWVVHKTNLICEGIYMTNDISHNKPVFLLNAEINFPVLKEEKGTITINVNNMTNQKRFYINSTTPLLTYSSSLPLIQRNIFVSFSYAL